MQKKMTYHQQTMHPLWQKKRLEILEERGFSCDFCGDRDSTLHVHHKRYKRGAMVWEYDNEELLCLCSQCHKEEHSLDEKLRECLAYTEEPIEKIIGFCLPPCTSPQGNLEISGCLSALNIPSDERIIKLIQESGIKSRVDIWDFFYRSGCLTKIKEHAFNAIKDALDGR